MQLTGRLAMKASRSLADLAPKLTAGYAVFDWAGWVYAIDAETGAWR
jgi:hypothetical protein